MKKFKDVEEIEEWFGPLNYEEFWGEVMLFNLAIQPREDCDAQIAAGEVDEETVLKVLKTLARIEITAAQGLPRRTEYSWQTYH